MEQRKKLLHELEKVAFHPRVDEDISELLESADIANQEDLNNLGEPIEWKKVRNKIERGGERWTERFLKKHDKGRVKVRPDRKNLMTEWKRISNSKITTKLIDLPMVPSRSESAADPLTFDPHSSIIARTPVHHTKYLAVDPNVHGPLEGNVLCDVCFGTVSAGSGGGLRCHACPQVAHKSCCPTANPSLWLCGLCLEGERYGSFQEDFAIEKYTKVHNREVARRRLQSYARMVPYRLSFSRLRKGVRAVQRCYRAIIFWRTQFKTKVKELRPFRLRLHHIFLYVTSMDTHHPETTHIHVLPKEFYSVMGAFPASLYEQYINTVKNKHENRRKTIGMDVSEHLNSTPLHIVDDSASADADADETTMDTIIESNNNKDKDTDKDKLSKYQKKQIEILTHEHREYPHYFLGLNSPYQNVKVGAKGDLFVTVTLIEHDWDSKSQKQIYRVDIPMKVTKEVNINSHIVGDIYGPEWYDTGMGNNKNYMSNFVMNYNEEYKIMKTNIHKMCSDVLIAGSSASVDVVYTVSEITQWPKAVALCQSTDRLTQCLIWRKIQTTCQSMVSQKELSIDEIPHNDELSKIQIMLPKRDKHKNGVSERGQIFDRLTAPKRTLDVDESGTIIEVADKVRTIVGGAICWSVVPGSNEDSTCGKVMLYANESLQSAKRRAWVVVMDHLLYIFNINTDLRPQSVVELKYFFSCKLDHNTNLIRLYRRKPPEDTYYIYVQSNPLRNEFLRVLQPQMMGHLSHHHAKPHIIV